MLIRSRLLLLVLAWAVPALAALVAVVHFAAHSEQHANERALRETARSKALVVERELDRRATVARMLATSRALLTLPALRESDLELLRVQSRAAMQGLDGWVEVRDDSGVLFDSRGPTTRQPPVPGPELDDSAPVSPLLLAAEHPPHAVVSHPVLQQGDRVAHIVVVVLPSELQRLFDVRTLPEGWVGTVMDSRHVVVARQPGGAGMVGRPATEDLRRHLVSLREGPFQSRSPGGEMVRGYFTTTPHGWSYAAAMPESQFGGYLQGTAAEILAGAVLLLTVAVSGALWVSRGIAHAVVSLEEMATCLEDGQPVRLRRTGIAECDRVASTLAAASQATHSAQTELQRQVAEAVERTRSAEQDAARSQRVAALGRLTGGVAHDFNNVLGVVSNGAHLVQRQAAAQPQLQSAVTTILRAVDMGSRLTQQLLRFAQRRPLKPQMVDICSSMPEWKELLANAAGRRIDVQMHCQDGTPMIVVDPAELELALINLALNARDAMPGGGTLRVNAHPATTEEARGLAGGPYVAIDVIDEGVGVDSATAARLFEPFVTTKPVGEGTGLGLAQVHGFCRQAGGAAGFSSVPGQGTRVTLLLPGCEHAPAAAWAPPAALPAEALAGLHVAVVEDNEALGDATTALLRSYGATVQRIRDAEAALNALDAGGRFDVVLSDVMMPGAMDGVGLARELQARTPPVPVVLISGYPPLLQGGDTMQVLRKPTSAAQLLDALLTAANRTGAAAP